MQRELRSESGFTLIELAVVLVLIGIAAALVLPMGLLKAANSAALDTEAQKLAGTIRLARQKSITQDVPGTTYGVRFENSTNATSYRLFSRNTATGSSWTGEEQKLDKHVIIDSAGHVEIVFDNSGNTTDTGIVVLMEVSGNNRTITLEVNSLGTVDIR